uniref:Uncharacterized protein n=1 Tax=Rhizophora mucronata TaxID=61149 RepID=A0A2P2PZ03_RHIMU
MPCKTYHQLLGLVVKLFGLLVPGLGFNPSSPRDNKEKKRT